MKDRPPPLATRLLVALFRRKRDRVVSRLDEARDFDEAVAGDLEEVYAELAAARGRSHAGRWYWGQVIRALPHAFTYRSFVGADLAISHTRIALRHLWRTRGYTAINVLGLGIALAFSVLALLYARSELSFDRFHPDYERIARLGTSIYFGQMDVWENTPFPLADVARAEVAGVEEAERLTLLRRKGIRVRSNRLEGEIHLSSRGFLSMFSFPMAHGSGTLERGQVILSDQAAQSTGAHVGEEVGLELANGTWLPFVVSGITQPIPTNSSIAFDYLVSEAHFEDAFGPGSETDWSPKSATATFIKLREGVELHAVAPALDGIGRAHNLDQFLDGREVEQLIPAEPIARAHFSTMITNRILRPNGDSLSLWVIVGIALLLVGISVVNFVNLSMGLWARRVREVGLRKVFGAARAQLVRQYTLEAVVVAVFALITGLALAWAGISTFNATTGQSFTIASLASPAFLALLVGLTLVVGLAAGLYPSVVLSGFQPGPVLKGQIPVLGQGRLGRIMVGFQLAVSIFLISATLVMSGQLNFLTSMDLGYNSELVILQEVRRGVEEETLSLYRERLLQDPRVVGVSGARATLLGDQFGSALSVSLDGQPMTLAASKIDSRFLDVLELDLAAGRDLSDDRPTDATRAVLVNEAFTRTFEVEVGDETPFAISREGTATIVGVVSDFHFMSLRYEISPTIFYRRPESNYRQILVRVRGGDLEGVIGHLEATWSSLQAGTLFSYRFLDDALQSQYIADARNRQVGTIGALVSLAIAIAGLLGVTALSVARRTREIGVRKILGASGRRIMLLFTSEYALVMAAAVAVAIPASYYLTNQWLSQFAYRVSVDAVVFIGAALLVIALAVATIWIQCTRSAARNPVDVIRYE